MGNSEADIKNLCPGALVHKGLAIRGGNVKSSKRDIAAWLNK